MAKDDKAFYSSAYKAKKHDREGRKKIFFST